MEKKKYQVIQNSVKKITKFLPPIGDNNQEEEEKVISKRRTVVNDKTSIFNNRKEREEKKNSIFVEQNKQKADGQISVFGTNQHLKSKKGDSKFSEKPLDKINEQRSPESDGVIKNDYNNPVAQEDNDLKFPKYNLKLNSIDLLKAENEELKKEILNFNQDKQNNKDLENRLKNCEKSLSDFHKLKLILLQKFSIFKD